MESRKMVLMKLFAGQEERHRHREWTCGQSGEGESGSSRDSSIDINAVPCVKQAARRKLLYNTGSSARGSGTTLRAGMGGWERGSRGRGYM